MDLKEFGRKFKELRQSRGLTQIELAEQLNISRSNISKYENGVHLPDHDYLDSICEFFGVSKGYLIRDYVTIGDLLDKKLNELDDDYTKNLSDEEKEKLAEKLSDIVKMFAK